MRRHLLPLLIATALTACATTPTVYAPSLGGNRGYSEQQIETDRFRIHFSAGADMSLEMTENMALRRAAEVTLEQGGNWFLVVDSRREGDNRNPVRLGGSVGHTTGSRRYSGTSVGLGISFDAGAGEKRASLEILIRTGEMPDDPDAYDAASILTYADGT